ncbi:unnamed protein product [Musa hybrid cultivar]
MPTSSTFSPGDVVISAVSLLVFALLDLLDFILCYFYRFLDVILEGNPVPCYCQRRGREERSAGEGGEEVSETLHGRRNLFREMGFPFWKAASDGEEERGELRFPRWSDCSCISCLSWQERGQDKLHLAVMEPSSQDTKQVGRKKEYDTDSTESVVFLHGFLSSSSLWVETVFHNLSEVTKQSFRMVAVDLLGFGRSPKPTNCTYTVREHLDMIEASVVRPLELNSYHIVAHSMGCIIALAMAAKHPESVKSLTLVAPVSPHVAELNHVFF